MVAGEGAAQPHAPKHTVQQSRAASPDAGSMDSTGSWTRTSHTRTVPVVTHKQGWW